MKKRQLKLAKYGIDTGRYMELRGFCRQYPAWKEQLDEMQDSVGSPALSGSPYTGGIGDSTGSLAVKRAELSQKCEIIERAAKIASPDIWQYIIGSVAYLKSFDELKAKGLPMERSAFYDTRRFFFYLLDQNRV